MVPLQSHPRGADLQDMRRRSWLLLLSALVVVAAACGPTKPTIAPAPVAVPPPVARPSPPAGLAPVVSGFACPVTGARYGDGFGPRGTGFHWGIDLFKPRGTPVVAVKAGTVRNVAHEGAGGNVVYLTVPGAGGNVYQFAHLLDFAGPDRAVARGAVIGHVGQTGNATAVHLHFEIRVGGINGTRVDPVPTLRAAGC